MRSRCCKHASTFGSARLPEYADNENEAESGLVLTIPFGEGDENRIGQRAGDAGACSLAAQAAVAANFFLRAFKSPIFG